MRLKKIISALLAVCMLLALVPSGLILSYASNDEVTATVGTASGKSSCVPAGNDNYYSVSEQIYTPEEIGYTGNITSIGFSAKGDQLFNIEIFLMNTDKQSFDNNTDWADVSGAVSVFSGKVNFYDGWNDIPLSSSFNYDGRNLMVIVVNKLGYIEGRVNFDVYPGMGNCKIAYSGNMWNYTPARIREERETATDFGSDKNQLHLKFSNPVNLEYEFQKAKVSGLKSNYAYTGSAIAPDYNVTSFCGSELIEGRDYTAEICDSNSETVTELIEDGDYTLTLTGISPYTGSKSFSFTVSHTDISSFKTSVKPDYTYTGSPLSIDLSLKDDSDNELIEGTDYTVEITDSEGENVSEVVALGAYTVTFCGIGVYCGEKQLTFNVTNIIPVGSPDGTATGVAGYLPYSPYYPNSLSQQIYMSPDIGVAGTVTSIAFYKGIHTSRANLEIYMTNTEKESFSSDNDWVQVSEDDLVFKGSVYFSENSWTDIELDKPFVYDGKNLLLTVNNVNSSSFAFQTFDDYRGRKDNTIYVYSRSDSYNPKAEVTQSGIRSYGRNVMRLMMNDVIQLIDIAEVTGLKDTYLYTGSPAELSYTVKSYSGTELIEGTDYTVEIRDSEGAVITEAVDEGEYTVTFTGIGKSKNSKTVSFSVSRCDINSLVYNVKDYYQYSGQAVNTGWTVCDTDGKQLTEGVDYSLQIVNSSGATVSQATEIDSYTATFTGLHSYTGEKTIAFRVDGLYPVGDGDADNSRNPININYNNSISQQIYTSEEIGIAGRITDIAFKLLHNSAVRNIRVYLSETEKDSFSGNTDWIRVSDDDIVFDGTVEFIGDEWTFISFSKDYTYNGGNLLLTVVDYTGTYGNPQYFAAFNSGFTSSITACSDNHGFNPTLQISDSGSLTDYKSQLKLRILDTSSLDSRINVANVSGVKSEYLYTGQPAEIECIVESYGGNLLREGIDYTAEIRDSEGAVVSQAIEEGEYSLTITGIGGYAGTKTLSFKIYRIDINGFDYNVSGVYPFTGEAVNGGWTLLDSEGKALAEGEDYTSEILNENGEPVSEAVEPGRYTVTFSGIKSYTGTKTFSFSIVKTVLETASDWNEFAENVASGISYSGITVTLANDISVNKKVGTVSGSKQVNPFSGTFDGNGHTVTADITDTANQGTALFCYIKGASIKNLTVKGTVKGDKHTGGAVGFSAGSGNSIKNCIVALDVNGGSHIGGILGHGLNSDISIENCVFDGALTGGTSAKGVFFGWGDNGGVKTVSHCLYVLHDGQNTSNLDLVKKHSGDVSVTGGYKTADVGSIGSVVYLIDIPDGVTASSPSISYNGTDYYSEGSSVSLTVDTDETDIIKLAVKKGDIPVPCTGSENGVYTFTMPGGNATVYAIRNSAAVKSISISGDKVVKGDYLTWTVKTSDDVMWLGFVGSWDGAEYKTYYKYTTVKNNPTENVTVTDNGDGTVEWTVSMRFTYAGTAENKVEKYSLIYKLSGSSVWEDAPDQVNGGIYFKDITVGKKPEALEPAAEGHNQYELISVTPKASEVSLGDKDKTFTVVTSSDVSKVRISYVNAETGKTKAATFQTTSTAVDSITTDENTGLTTWVINFKFAAPAQNDKFSVDCRGLSWGEAKTVSVAVV